MDVLTTFGEQTDEIQQNCKYAKWKAAYIHNCLRNGETPVPGPAGGEEEAPSTSAGGSSQPSLGERLNPTGNCTLMILYYFLATNL